MSLVTVRVPELGGFAEVDVLEVLVVPGATVAPDEPLLTLESDKASMDVPSPAAGIVRVVHVKAGDKVSEGTAIVELEVAEGGSAGTEAGRDSVGASQAETSSREHAADSPTSRVAADLRVGRSSEADEGPFDLTAEVLVLGSGPGGYTAAFRAADLGKQVVLVERHAALGGVCLNVGCIPSKALLHAAKVIDDAAEMAAHGITFGPPSIDLDALRGFKTGVVKRMSTGLSGLADRRKVTVIQGVGTLVSPHRLAVETAEGRKVVAFEQAILAAGSRVARIPGIPWDDPRVIDSTGALELRYIPKRLLVIGGGIIGLEMATVYAALGSRVTVVELLDRLMPGADADLVKPLQKRLEKRLEGIHVGTRVAKVEAEKKGLRAVFEGPNAPEPQLYDRVLVAVGRRPNGDQIGAEAAGVAVDGRGFLAVDREMRTNVPHVFAIGDLVGQPMLAHKASHQGKVAAEVAAGEKSSFDARVIPSVAYTDPEVAWVGVTEDEARAQGLAYTKGAFPWSASGRAQGLGRDDGTTKLLFDEKTHRLIGAGIVGSSAGDLIAEAALAIEMGCEMGDLALTIHPHPTLSETIAFAAEMAEGTITDLYIPRRKR